MPVCGLALMCCCSTVHRACAGGVQSHGGRGVFRCGFPASAVHEVHREGRVCQIPFPERLPAAFRTHHEKKQVCIINWGDGEGRGGRRRGMC